jgi:PIN domain nuclease of toxin-antitoxin system
VRARRSIEDPASLAYVSAVSLWEVALKSALGKLKLPAPYAEIFPSQLEQNGFSVLSITSGHGAKLLAIPFHHRDPFDRLLLAQAEVEGMTLVTDDRQLSLYGTPLIW